MQRGFTLIELMITLAVMGVLVTLAAPSFYDFILMQRLKAASQQLVTDLQFARSEAASRNQLVRVQFSAGPSGTCYVLFTGPADNSCNCRNAVWAPVSAVCPANAVEIRTVVHRTESRIEVLADQQQIRIMRYEPINGAMSTNAVDLTGAPAQQFIIEAKVAETSKRLRTLVSRSGRPNICVPAGSTMSGEPC